MSVVEDGILLVCHQPRRGSAVSTDTVVTLLLARSLMPFATASLSISGGLPNAPIYETVLPLVAIACLSLIGMLMIGWLKK